ncbi:MAG: AAA family ATPase [Pseudomonas sp.]|nr:AAA family ATPase [Pseudomonas sp.]
MKKMRNPVIFLIGLHGVGKSTIGKILATEQGFKHISLGDLCRLLHKKKIPTGYGLRFLRLLAKHERGQMMTPELVNALMDEIRGVVHLRGVVVDGFPAEPLHVLSLPTGSTVVHLTCTEHEREQRLAHRSQITVRKWNCRIESRRDEQVQAVFSVAQESGILRTAEIANGGDPEVIAGRVLAASFSL